MKVEIFDKDTNHTLVTLDNVKDVTHVHGNHYVITSSKGRLFYTLSDDEVMLEKHDK